MVKAFCLVCIYFEVKHWCLGYCREKDIQIFKAFRNCSKFGESQNVIDDPTFIIEWYQRAVDVSRFRNELVKVYFKLREKENGNC